MTMKKTTRRVMMFPATGNANENRFIDVLVTALREQGVDVREWHKARLGQQAPVLHVHWPEVIADIARRPWQGLRGRYLAFNLFDTVRRIKRQGGKVVWTVHDLQVHDEALRSDPFCLRLLQRFAAEVDVFVSLTEAGVQPIRRDIVRDSHRPVLVARHPHYRSVMSRSRPEQVKEIRRQWDIEDGRFVVACLGSMRANKCVDVLAEAFAASPPGKATLLLAGSAPDAVRRSIEKSLLGRADVRLRFGRVPEGEMIDLYSASDLLVFPATGYFNSGTVYTALSLNVPVLAEDSPQNRELAGLVGEGWVRRFTGPLTASALTSAIDAGPASAAICPMDAFRPEFVAARHAAIYGF